jgi:hypothetical protein
LGYRRIIIQNNEDFEFQSAKTFEAYLEKLTLIADICHPFVKRAKKRIYGTDL